MSVSQCSRKGVSPATRHLSLTKVFCYVVCLCVCVFISLSFSLLLFCVLCFFCTPLQQRRKTIVLFGAGRSSSSLIRYLLHHSEKENWCVRVADISRSVAAQVCLSGHFSSCVCVCVCVYLCLCRYASRGCSCICMSSNVSLFVVRMGMSVGLCGCVCVSVSTLCFCFIFHFPRSFTSSLLCSHLFTL
jgi:hypothetical protein